MRSPSVPTGTQTRLMQVSNLVKRKGGAFQGTKFSMVGPPQQKTVFSNNASQGFAQVQLNLPQHGRNSVDYYERSASVARANQ